jgi:Family of unknown function (DUF6675)
MRIRFAVRGRRLPLVGVLLGIATIQPCHTAQLDDATCLRSAPQPEFATLNAAPLVRVTHEAPAAGGECFNKTDSTATWITVASLVETSDTRKELIGRFGAISQLVAVRYWSVTDRKWRPLLSSAVALNVVQTVTSRPDYSAEELQRTETLPYRITDTRTERAVTYSLRLSSIGPREFAVETANVDAVKEWGITFYAPGGLHTVYYLAERAPGRWAYSSITRIVPASFLAQGHEKSYVNRAVALYRHYMHIPTDQDPPADP